MTLHPNTQIGSACRAIMAACAEAFGCTHDDLVGKTRKAHVVSARHAAAWMMYKHLPLSLENVGLILGGRDHSTITNAVQGMADRFETGDPSAGIVKSVAEELFGEAATPPQMPRRAALPRWAGSDMGKEDRASTGRTEARPPDLFVNDTLEQARIDAERNRRRAS